MTCGDFVQRHRLLLPIMESPLRHLLMLPIIILLGTSGIVTPVMSMELKNGMLGHFVDFAIPVSFPSEYRIDWNFGHTGKVTVMARMTSGGSPQYNPLYKGRCELFINGTFRLNTISKADEGTYKVKLFNPDTFTSYVQQYQLTVYVPVSSVTLTSNTSGLLWPGKDSVSLHCSAGGTHVSYSWSMDDIPLPVNPQYRLSQDNSTLIISPVSSNDSGVLRCAASNWVNKETSDKLNLNLALPVSSVTLTSNTSGLLWPGRDSVSLHCSASGTDVSYSWSMDDSPIPENPQYHLSQDNTALIISPVSSNDSGVLRCAASNWVNKETSDKLNLNLASQISAVMLSSSTSGVLWAGKESVSLYCSAQGSAITFSWSLNGKPVPLNPKYNITQNDSPQRSTLTISPVSKNHTGPFTCSASNLVNSQTSNELNLSLKWKPEGSIACTKQRHDSFLQLACSWPGGQPAANLTMRFNNIEEMGQNEVTRNVSFFQSTEKSKLTCISDHLGKKVSCSLSFWVPPPPLPQDKNNAVMEGEKANLKTEALP